jgi:hypothetical protein
MRVRQMLRAEQAVLPARSLDAQCERLVLANLAAYRGVSAGGEVRGAAEQQDLAVDRDVGRVRVVDRAQILNAADQDEPGRDDQPLPEAAELLQRVER